MPPEINPVATHHLPIFITPPGQIDILTAVTAGFLLAAVVAFGLLFLRLHSLPERMAHRGRKLQFEIVAVLCLIALFTHIHGFWIAALLLALVEFPDVSGWMGRTAASVERIAGIKSAEPSTEPPPDERHTEPKSDERADYALSGELSPESAKDKELTHA